MVRTAVIIGRIILALCLLCGARAADEFAKTLNTVAELQAYPPRALHKTVLVLGLNTPGDGGGGVFTPTNAVASGTNRLTSTISGVSWERIVADPNGLNAAIQEQVESLEETDAELAEVNAAIQTQIASLQGRRIYSIRTFNATSDGVTDDTTAIRNAIAAAPAGATIHFPEGTNLISGTLTFSNAVQIVANGTIIQANTVLAPIVDITATVSLSGLLVIEAAENLTTWDTNANVIATRAGVRVKNASHSSLQNVVVKNPSTGFLLTNSPGTILLNCRAENTWLTNSWTNYNNSAALNINDSTGTRTVIWTSYGFGQGIVGGGRAVGGTVTAADITGAQDNGVYISSGDGWHFSCINLTNIAHTAFKVRGRNYNLSNIGVDGAQAGIVLSPFAAQPDATLDIDDAAYSLARGFPGSYFFNGHNLNLNGFTIRNVPRYGVNVDNTTSLGTTNFAHDVTIANGIMYNVGTEAGYHGIWAQGDAVIMRNVIINKYGTDSSSYGILYSGIDGVLQFKDGVISDCLLRSASSPNGIYMLSLADATLKDNQVNSTTSAYRWNSVDGCVVEGNRGLGAGAMRWASASSGFVVKDNKLAGSVLFLAPVTTSHFTDNLAAGFPTDTTNYWAWNDPAAPQDIASTLTYNATYQNLAVGTTAYSTDNSIPFHVRRDRAGRAALWMRNNTAGGSAVFAASSSDSSADIGAWSSGFATSRRQDRVGIALNGDAAGIIFEGSNVGQDTRWYMGSTTMSLYHDSDELSVGSGSTIGFASSATANTGNDVGFKRLAAGVVGVSNGSSGAGKISTSTDSAVFWSSGSGTPEGNVTAKVGSFYFNTSGGATTTFWVKESGTGNTGWVAK